MFAQFWRIYVRSFMLVHMITDQYQISCYMTSTVSNFSSPTSLLRKPKIDFIVAPYEADSQLAFANLSGLAQVLSIHVYNNLEKCWSLCQSVLTFFLPW